LRGARTAAPPLFARERCVEKKVVVIVAGAVLAEHVGVERRVRLRIVLHVCERAVGNVEAAPAPTAVVVIVV
jgi:hypothetical protein